MTNQKKIQTMSTEKLAEYLNFMSLENCDYCPAQEDCNLDNPFHECCVCKIKKWLKMEVSADDD